MFVPLPDIMTIHLFNPEHDIALASGLTNFTAPHAGRQLRSDLAFLPALWASENDVILVDHVESAERKWRRLCGRLARLGIREASSRHFTDYLPHGTFDNMQPWGWDAAIRAEMIRKGISTAIMPTEAQITAFRQLSHRRTAARLLTMLHDDSNTQAECPEGHIIGEAFECQHIDDIKQLLERYGLLVLKAPWSSSGRGIRFLDATQLLTQTNWITNILQRQGSVMVEPCYKKVKDLAMEFEATDEGIKYKGLSLFATKNGAYMGNILATENAKREIINSYIPVCLLDRIKEKICTFLDLGDYRGPFGIDMMVVKESHIHSSITIRPSPLLLHPCVEINLRRTMGHVALSMTPLDDDIKAVMRIDFDGTNYKLRILRL